MANTSANRLKVNRLYNELLGRDASFGAGSEFDADYWLGKSEADIRSGISGSSEFLNRKALIDSGITDEATLDKMVGVGGTKTNLHRDFDPNNTNWNADINWAGTADDTAAILADINADKNNVTLPVYPPGGDNTGGDNTGDTSKYLTSDDLTSWWDNLDKSSFTGNQSGGMDDFMKFMMLMSVMGGRGGGMMGGGSQYGYGGLNPGGVMQAYDPWQQMKDGFSWFNDSFGSGSTTTGNLNVPASSS